MSRSFLSLIAHGAYGFDIIRVFRLADALDLSMTPPAGTPGTASINTANATTFGFLRITIRADQMGGVPCMRGQRLPVTTIVGP